VTQKQRCYEQAFFDERSTSLKFSGATMNGIQQWGGYGGQQLVPQGLLGGLLGASMGSGGRGIVGGFGNAGWANQMGQNAGGLGGANLQFQQDPLAQAYAQQQLQQQLQQLNQQQSPQGFWGSHLGQGNQQIGNSGLFGQSGVSSNFSSGANQQGYGQNQQLQQILQMQQLQLLQQLHQLAHQLSHQLSQQIAQLQQQQQPYQAYQSGIQQGYSGSQQTLH